MKILPSHGQSIRGKLDNASDLLRPLSLGATGSVSLRDLQSGTRLGGPLRELSGRSVLVLTAEPLAARRWRSSSWDAVVRRLVMCLAFVNRPARVVPKNWAFCPLSDGARGAQMRTSGTGFVRSGDLRAACI